MPFPWQRRFFRGDSATQAAHCCGDLFLSIGGVIQVGSGLERRTGRYMTGVKKPALGGPVFPGAVLIICLISTLLRP